MMQFDSWTNRSADVERRKRLTFGYTVGVVTVGSLLTALALAKPMEQLEAPEENILDVAFAEEPEPEAELEPEPEPEPIQPEPQKNRPAPQSAPTLPELQAPDEIPKDAPQETDAVDNPYASSDPYAYGAGQRGNVPSNTKTVVKVVAAPAPVAFKPTGPVRVTADTVPPKQLSGSGAMYPEAAKAAGIQGTVVVAFVVDANGNVTNVRAVRGPEALRAACEASVKSRKYEPAKNRATGQALAVTQNKTCKFRLST